MLLTVLAPSWPFLAPSWDVLAQSWHVLAPSWVDFGCQLGIDFGAERRHAVPSRPRRCDRIAIKREIRENRERGREEDHMF